jgi:hypothetical protein
MKKNFLMMAFVCLFIGVTISSCKKDDKEDENNGSIGNTLTVTVENGSSLNGKIDAVKAKIDYEKSNGGWDEYIAASAPYSNGGFTLQLPETVSDTYLGAFDTDEIPDGVTVSNLNAKIGWGYIEAYKEDENVGYFYLGTGTTDADWEGELIYSNGDVNITGTETDVYSWESDGETYTETETNKYSMYLKNGWNIVYEKWTEKGNNTEEYELTTTAPSGAKWYYYDYSSKSLSSRIQKTPFISSKRK